MAKTEHFDPLSSKFINDRAAFLNRIRENYRVYEHEGLKYRIKSIFHADMCSEILMDPTVWSSDKKYVQWANPEEHDEPAGGVHSRAGWASAGTLVFADPPRHTQLRGVLRQFFLPKNVRKLEEPVREWINQQLDICLERGTVDFPQEISGIIAAGAICKMLDLSMENAPKIHVWGQEIFKTFGLDEWVTDTHPFGDDKDEKFVANILREVDVFVASYLADRANLVEGSIMWTLANSGLDEETAAGLGQTLILGANDTVISMLSNTLWYLDRNPEQRQLLYQDPEKLVAPCIEEVLRIAPPIVVISRLAACDTILCGEPFKKGDYVMIWLTAANHDPAVFENPDRFDITRQPNRHTAFGTGVHICIGNAVGRLEGRLFLQALIDRNIEFHCPDPTAVTWDRNPAVSGPEHMPMSFSVANRPDRQIASE